MRNVAVVDRLAAAVQPLHAQLIGDAETLLNPGDAATFRAGVALGHCLWNRSALPTTCLVVGTRAQVDQITYPDHDRVCLRDRSLEQDIWLDTAGRPATRPY